MAGHSKARSLKCVSPKGLQGPWEKPCATPVILSVGVCGQGGGRAAVPVAVSGGSKFKVN